MFDLDETLYPIGNPSIKKITDRMNEYIVKTVNVPDLEVKSFRESLFKKYGTTGKGLVSEYGINLQDFLRYVHAVDLSLDMEPDPEVRRMLDRIRLPKYVFTNADRFHATRVLKQVNLLDCFDGIIDVLDVQPYCKPEQEAFEKALFMIGMDSGDEVIFLDDNPLNVDQARELGMFAIQVGSRKQAENAAAHLNQVADFQTLEIYNQILR